MHERPSDIEDHVNNIYDIIYEAASVSNIYRISKKKGKRRGISKATRSDNVNKHKVWFNDSP